MEKNSAKDILYREMEEMWKDPEFFEQQKKLFEAELAFWMKFMDPVFSDEEITSLREKLGDDVPNGMIHYLDF